MKKKGQKSCLLLHPDPELDPDQVRLWRPCPIMSVVTHPPHPPTPPPDPRLI